jgi:uncharacterized membrane protein YphA (DoxX/SURF4 family)
VEVWSQAVAVARLDQVSLPQWAWLPPLTVALAHMGLALGVVLSLLLALGAWARPAALGVAALAIGAPLVEQQLYSNHVTLLAVTAAWLACSRCDTVWALRPPATGRAPVRLRDQLPIMTQVSVVYLATGLVKVNERFLSGDVIASTLRVDLPPTVTAAMAWAAVTTELALAVCLWLPRTRWWAASAGLVLHLSIPVLMTSTAQLVPFSMVMVACYPLFLQGTRPPEGREVR